MIQLILFVLSTVVGLYGALRGESLALALAMAGMWVAGSGLLTPAPEQQTKEQQQMRAWLQQYGWLFLMLSAVVATGFTVQQIAADEFSRSSTYTWLLSMLLILLAGIVHDYRSPAVEEVEATAEQSAAGSATANATDNANKTDNANEADNTDKTDNADTTTVDTVAVTPVTAAAANHSWRWRLRRKLLPRLRRIGATEWRDWWLDWLLIGIITAVALWLRLHRLNDFLPTMHGDEGEMGELARLALQGPAGGLRPLPLPVFGIGFLDHPTLFHHIQAGALFFFGDSLTGLRTLSAITGALCVPPIYLLARRGWGRVAATTAAWLLAVSHLHIQYSRIALNNIQSVWMMILLILFLASAAEQSRRQQGRPLLFFVLAGLTIGVSQYFYYGSRLLPVIAALGLLVLLCQRRLSFVQAVGMGVATLLPYVPLLYIYSRNWQSFLNRTQGVSIISPAGMAHTLGADATWPQDIPRLFWEQFKRNIAFFVDSGDKSSFYLQDLPAFDPVTVALFWLGLGLIFVRYRRFVNAILLVWLLVGLLLAGILTNDSPYGPRLIVMVPAIYLIASVPLQRLYTFLFNLWPSAARWSLVLVLGLIGFGTFLGNYSTYFERYPRSLPNMMPIGMAHYIREHSQDSLFYIYGAPNFYAEYSVLRFITPESTRMNASLVEETEAAIHAMQRRHEPGNAGAATENEYRGIVIIALLHRLQELETLVEKFPGGVREEHQNRAGNLLYVSYRLPPTWFAATDDARGEAGSGTPAMPESDISVLPPAALSPLPTPAE